MKLQALLIVALFTVAACSNVETKPSTIRIQLEMSQPRDDFSVQARLPQKIETIVTSGAPYVPPFSLSYAVICNSSRTECKHAVVSSRVELQIEHANGSVSGAAGKLISRFGRTAEFRDAMTTMSKSVSEGVELIAEGEQIQPFRVIVGESVVVAAPFDAQLRVSLAR